MRLSLQETTSLGTMLWLQKLLDYFLPYPVFDRVEYKSKTAIEQLCYCIGVPRDPLY